MSRHLRIKNFVKSVLGCTCPDKVFVQIEESRVTSFPGLRVRSITIGGRLLIYIWQIEGGLEGEPEDMLTLLQAGKMQRDDQCLNRFRLVLASSNPQIIEFPARLYFSQFGERDEHMHIHVVSENSLKYLF